MLRMTTGSQAVAPRGVRIPSAVNMVAIPRSGDPDIDPAEPTTLVVFELEEIPEGTRLTVTESGFDQIPAARRGKAYRSNESGWTEQMENIRKYVERKA